MTSPASGYCGPITADCPASHLASVISLMALNRLLHACDAPQTAGDVVRLCREGKLTSDNFKWLGPRRRSEIGAAWCWPDSISRTVSATAKRGAPSNDQARYLVTRVRIRYVTLSVRKVIFYDGQGAALTGG